MDKLLSREEAAGLLRISKKTLHTRMNDGLPSFLVGGRRLFREVDLEAYVQEHRVVPANAGEPV